MDAAAAERPLKIAVIDDEPTILSTIREFLVDQGHQTETYSSGDEALPHLQEGQVDIVISDIKMPGMDGFEVLEKVKKQAPGAETILVTGHGDIDSAVRALREGAFDFFTKPVNLRDLIFSLKRTTRFHALRLEKDRYKESLGRITRETQEHFHLDQIVGGGKRIAQVKELIQTLQETNATTVMIVGESGTGKELVARAIHHGGRRAGEAFVSVNCTALPESLIESELYGHEKGAFTDARDTRKGQFELADGGTIFLDEIGDMSLTAQAKVLRTIEEREILRVGGSKKIPVDVRIISATNKDLGEAIAEGTFREDLYYRMNTFVIALPALRERPEDIPVLAETFRTRYAGEMRKDISGFTPEALEALKRMPFRGNVRELRNLLERAVILCKESEIGVEHLTLDQLQTITRSRATGYADLNLTALEKEFIQEAIRRTSGNQVRAAALLGISRDALRRRLAQHNLSPLVHREEEGEVEPASAT